MPQVIERYLEIGPENEPVGSANSPRILPTTAAPGGDGGDQDDAAIGSIALRTNGSIYKKITDTNTTADWTPLGDVQVGDLTWRPELVRASTNELLAAGDTNPSGWADNEQGLDDTDFSIGEFVIGDVDGTPLLFEITALPGFPNITLTATAGTDAMADNDVFVTRNHLPDTPAAQEEQAILLYNGSEIIKIGDFNWSLADGINLTSGWTPTNGAPAADDTVEAATEKIEKGVADLVTMSGESRNATSFTAFSSPASLLLAASQTAKALFQRLGILLAQLRGVQVAGITAIATVDSVPIASVRAVKWMVYVFEDATPANGNAFEVYASNEGTGTNVDTTSRYSKLKNGANFDNDLTIDVSGGEMRLRMASTTSGITVTARRVEVVKSVL